MEHLPSQGHTDKSVVVDKNCVTARGAGASIEFSLKLLEVLMGADKKEEVAQQMAFV